MKRAKKEDNPYDFAWIVFDRDGHQNIAIAFEEARTCNPAINIAFTAVCFEYYVLLHFFMTMRQFKNCSEVIKELKKYLPEYEKADNLFPLLEENMEIGLNNSRWSLNQNKDEIDRGKKPYELGAYSNVHELISYLYSLLG